jgi:hypothetical protein
MTSDHKQNREDEPLKQLTEGIGKDVKEIRQIVLHLDERMSDIIDEVVAIRDTLATYELGSSYVPDGGYDFYRDQDD